MKRRLEMFLGEIRHRCEDDVLRTMPCVRCGIVGLEPGDVVRADPTDMRTFDTGATRNQDTTKLDPEGFYSPLVVERYSQYLHKHRFQADGKLRDSDNWTKGMPLAVYIKSAFRHFLAWWKAHRGYATEEEIEDSICALIFNAQGYLYELLKVKQSQALPPGKIQLVQVKMPPTDPALLDPARLDSEGRKVF